MDVFANLFDLSLVNMVLILTAAIAMVFTCLVAILEAAAQPTLLNILMATIVLILFSSVSILSYVFLI